MEDEITAGAAGTAFAPTRPAIHGAARVVATAAAIGLSGQFLFFDVGLGINFPLFIVALLGAGWALRRPAPGPCAATCGWHPPLSASRPSPPFAQTRPS